MRQDTVASLAGYGREWKHSASKKVLRIASGAARATDMTKPSQTPPLRPQDIPVADDREAEALHMILQALHLGLCLRWTYNRTATQVAPQLLYRRNGKFYCDAVAMEQDGVAVQEPKLGSFRLSGLGKLVLTTETAAPWPELDLADARYEDVIATRAAV